MPEGTRTGREVRVQRLTGSVQVRGRTESDLSVLTRLRGANANIEWICSITLDGMENLMIFLRAH